jgi:hypothetical protein
MIAAIVVPFVRLRLRGPSGAQDEFLLAATVQNLRKMAKLIPLPAQMPPESKQVHARLTPCNILNSWAADFFNTIGGGFNRSAQHSNLLAKMECGHEAATSHLLFCNSAV